MISPSAVAVSADLADAALGCTALVRARKLAEWVGPGKELTSTGVLRPALAAEACRALDIQLPAGRLRSALDVDDLMLDWAAAVDSGFVVADGRHAHAVPDLAAQPAPEFTLNAWVRGAARGVGVPDDPCSGCLTVLHELQAGDGQMDLEELADAVEAMEAATEPGAADGEPCPDCGALHDPADLFSLADFADDEEPEDRGGEDPEGLEGEGQDSMEHVVGTVAILVAYGAAEVQDGMVRLTPLGSMLASSVFEGCAPQPEADAGTLMSTLSELPPLVARTMAGPWLRARSAEGALRELLAFAESAAGGQRFAALAFGRELGPEAAEAWREWAERPGFGAYARHWLAAQGEPAMQNPADEAWLIMDALSIMLDTLPDTMPPFLLAAALQQQTGIDVTEVLPLLRISGHPATSDVVARLRQPSLMPLFPGVTAG
jgi:hypothetical protein